MISSPSSGPARERLLVLSDRVEKTSWNLNCGRKKTRTAAGGQSKKEGKPLGKNLVALEISSRWGRQRRREWGRLKFKRGRAMSNASNRSSKAVEGPPLRFQGHSNEKQIFQKGKIEGFGWGLWWEKKCRRTKSSKDVIHDLFSRESAPTWATLSAGKFPSKKGRGG